MTRRRLPVLMEARLPPTYGHCIAGTEYTRSQTERAYGKRCQVPECKYHLHIKRSEDVAGRRHDGLAPEWTVTGARASGPSCALDVAKQGEHSAEQISDYLGMENKRRVEQIIANWRKEGGAVRLLEVDDGK